MLSHEDIEFKRAPKQYFACQILLFVCNMHFVLSWEECKEKFEIDMGEQELLDLETQNGRQEKLAYPFTFHVQSKPLADILHP